MSKFRFEDLKIWQNAIEVADELFEIADELESKHLYRFAEQLRGAGLSISNNIAEGSGSNSSKEFQKFLNYARRSTFEVANIVMILARRRLLDDFTRNELLSRLDDLCRQITNFQRSLDSTSK